MTYHNQFDRPFLFQEGGLSFSPMKGVMMGDSVSSTSDKEFIYTEALAHWSTRYQDPSGFSCQITIEAESGVEVLKKAAGTIAHLIELKCEPLRFGNGSNANHNSEPPLQQLSAATNPICPVHGIEMRKWTKGNRTWYSHRWEGGWCKGGTT